MGCWFTETEFFLIRRRHPRLPECSLDTLLRIYTYD
jgi:hypothetical protein